MADTILVIDDDASVREMLADVLADEGLDVVTATDGLQALRLLQTLRPRLLLLDLRMPRLDGAAFACAYHTTPAPHAPIILLTASPALLTRQAALQMEASAFLHKPFDLGELLDLVHAILQSPASFLPGRAQGLLACTAPVDITPLQR